MSENQTPETPQTLPHTMRTRQPWPMWPIALSIVLFVGIYTFIQLNFRKEGQAYEPFQAMMDRKNAIVEKNMYDWYGLTTTRAAAPIAIASPAAATVQSNENVLEEAIPEQLKYYMPGKPILLPGFIKTDSPDSLTPGQPLAITLEVPAAFAAPADERLNLLSFYKEGELYLLASLFVEKFEDIPPADLASTPTQITFLIPTDPIAAETIQVRFLTAGRLTQWQIQNLDPSAAVEEDKTATP